MAGNAEQTNTELHIPADEHGAGFPPFDSSTFASQILWLAITFGLFYWIMKNVAVPRIAGILEDREDRIAGDIAEANRLKQETDEAIAAYEQALAEARAKAHGIAQDTRSKLKADQEARREKAEADLNKKLIDAEAQIAKVKSEALDQVGDIASETTSALVEALIGKAPTKTDLNKAVKSAMN
ncbi:F-type H+-transporting ATPase subunit b [Roseibium hamelinense]|uniref:ATP synthase subunit b n=1 Tax=Roseibium hamelinense TaxID=150831 RepID=A0A562T3N6_9HYPH|nr:F0F1 ATP synthase subunit B [Roseibium hamelinense]MTI42908.1 F0F1 ATP synthase subunit B [Roseibium hamelinense]TWI87656.1 F-type H+-transporting ATPase subunit b [Roseibium hamelinense]